MDLTTRRKIELTGLNYTWGTNCKLCRHCIRRTEPSVWLSNPMGLSHTACALSKGLISK